MAGLRASTRLEVVRRCVDLADLLAAAAAGQGRVALLSAELRLLERSCVAQLEEQGLIVVGVTAPADEDQERRLRQLGIDVVIGSDASALAVESAVDAARAGRGVNDRLAALMAPGAGTPQWSPTQTFPTQTAPTPATSRQASEPVEPAPDEGAVRYRRIAVWGPAGAPGRSTIALNVAAELARGGVSTLLAHAHPYGGTLAAALGLIRRGRGTGCRGALGRTRVTRPARAVRLGPTGVASTADPHRSTYRTPLDRASSGWPGARPGRSP